MKPLKVTIHLASPIVAPTYPIMLDGLIAGLWVRRLEDAGDLDAWNKQHDLPLDRYVSPGGDWVFKASALHGVPIDRGVEFATSRIEVGRIAESVDSGILKLRAQKINKAGGHFKSQVIYRPVCWMEQMEAHAIGEIEGVRDILGDLEFLGGKRSLCMGRVASVEVEEMPEAECRWWQRPMPLDTEDSVLGEEEVAVQHATLRPPYWKRQHRQPVLISTTRYPV